jgi:hypothetical protein
LLDKLSGGSRNVLLQTPEGDMVMPQQDTRLDVDKHANLVSIALGGAKVQYEFDGVSEEGFQMLAAGIAF